MRVDLYNIIDLIRFIKARLFFVETNFKNFQTRYYQFENLSETQKKSIGSIDQLLNDINSDSRTFTKNTAEIISNATEFSLKLEKLLKYFLELSEYNRNINFVTENIADTNKKLEKLFVEFKSNSEKLGKMANSVKQLALNTIIKSYHGQDSQNTISIIAENVTAFSEEIIGIIDLFKVEFMNYSKLSEKINYENEKFVKFGKTIEENIVNFNKDIDLYRDYFNKITYTIPNLNVSAGHISETIRTLGEIKNNLSNITQEIDENGKLNLLKFDEFNAIFNHTNYNVSELSELVETISNLVKDDKKNEEIFIKNKFTDFSFYNFKFFGDIFLSKLLFLNLGETSGNIFIPFIVEKWEYINTRMLMIIYIRDDIRFSDGTELTSEDIIYSIETFLKNTKDGSFSILEGYKEFISGKNKTISGINQLNDKAISFKLKETNYEFILNLAKFNLHIIKKDSYPENFLSNTCGQYFLKDGSLERNEYFYFQKVKRDRITFGKKKDYDICFGSGENDIATGFHYFFLSKGLSPEKRDEIFGVLSKGLDYFDISNMRKKTVELNTENELKELIIYSMLKNDDLETFIKQKLSDAGIEAKITHKKVKKYDMTLDKFNFYSENLFNLLYNLKHSTNDIFNARFKMLSGEDIEKYEELFFNERFLYPFEIISEKYELSEGTNILKTSFDNIFKSRFFSISENDFEHFFDILKHFNNRFEMSIKDALLRLDELKEKSVTDYNALLNEFDFFQGGMEYFSKLSEELEATKKLIKPIIALDFSHIKIEQMIFNNLKLSLNSYSANLEIYENFLFGFKQKLEKIFQKMNRINELSYFSSMEAEKNPGIKEDIIDIITQIRMITKENTLSNLEIEVLLNMAMMAVKNLKMYISRSLSNLEDIFNLIKGLEELGGNISDNNSKIKGNFQNILDNIDSMNGKVSVSLEKINELLTIYRESEKHFFKIVNHVKILNRNYSEFEELISEKRYKKNIKDIITDPNKVVSRLKELNLTYTSLPLTFDPHMATDNTSVNILSFVFTGLFVLTKDLFILPHLIKKWSLTEGGMLALFELRDDLYFSNGEKITVSDIVYNFYKIFNKKAPSPTAFLYENIKGSKGFSDTDNPFIDGIVIIDEKRFGLRFSNIYIPFFLNLGTIYASILWRGNSVLRPEIPVGVGPFIIDTYSESEIILLKNTNYFMKVNNFERVNIRIIKDEKRSQKEFLDKKIDMIMPDINFIDDIKKSKVKIDGKVHSISQLDIRYLGFNVGQRPELQLKTVRQAICHAINREEMVERTQKGISVVAEGILPKTLQGHIRSIHYKYDPQRASELLKISGFKDGIKIPLILSYSDNEIENAKARMVRDYLRDVDIAVELNPMNWKDFIIACREKRVQMFQLGWIADNGDPDSFFYPLFHSKNIGVSGNYFNYKNKKIDDMLDSAMSILSKEKRLKMYNEMENIIVEEAPALFISHSLHYTITGSVLRGYKCHPLNFINPDEWWKF